MLTFRDIIHYTYTKQRKHVVFLWYKIIYSLSYTLVFRVKIKSRLVALVKCLYSVVILKTLYKQYAAHRIFIGRPFERKEKENPFVTLFSLVCVCVCLVFLLLTSLFIISLFFFFFWTDKKNKRRKWEFFAVIRI